MADALKKALESAKANLISCVEQRRKIEAEREKLDKEIHDWQRVVESLSTVLEESNPDLPSDILMIDRTATSDPYKTMRFTDAVREILRTVGIAMSAPEVRDALTRMGFDFSKYKQELVPVHNTLKRLEEQGEIESIKNIEGQTVGYRHINPVSRALQEEIQRSMKSVLEHPLKSFWNADRSQLIGANESREQTEEKKSLKGNK